jgi:hypothetical protein
MLFVQYFAMQEKSQYTVKIQTLLDKYHEFEKVDKPLLEDSKLTAELTRQYKAKMMTYIAQFLIKHEIRPEKYFKFDQIRARTKDIINELNRQLAIDRQEWYDESLMELAFDGVVTLER